MTDSHVLGVVGMVLGQGFVQDGSTRFSGTGWSGNPEKCKKSFWEVLPPSIEFWYSQFYSKALLFRGPYWIYEVFSSSSKITIFSVRKFFKVKTFETFISYDCQLFVGLNFLDGGSTFKNGFLGFRTSRCRKSGCFHSGWILWPRPFHWHLKHGNRSSQSLDSSVTLLLF